MNKKRKSLLNEILEHTIDCDYNRSMQFKAHKEYSKRYRRLQTVQNICLLAVILYYMSFFSFVECFSEYKWLNILPVVFSSSAVLCELWCLFGDYSGLSQRCWLSSQAYTKLYRDCQFLHNYIDINNIEMLRSKAEDIAEQLNGYNLLSPHIDEKIYEETRKELQNKSYPLETFIKNGENNSSFKERLLDYFKFHFGKCPIEVIHFGSSVRSCNYNDIDLAIFFYNEDVDKKEIYEKITNLEKIYLSEGLVLDISFFLKKDFDDITLYPYLRSIQEGELIYQSDKIEKSIFGNIKLNLFEYKNAVEELFESLDCDLDNNRFDILKIYHFFYSFMSYILLKNEKYWDSEESFRREFIGIKEIDNEPLSDKFKHDVYLCYEILRKLRVYKLEYSRENWTPDGRIKQTIYTIKEIITKCNPC